MINIRKLWENSNISAAHPDLAASVRFDEPMKEHTTFKVGGPADLFLTPSSVEELRLVTEFFLAEGIPVSVLGGGSNILVADKGIRGVVVGLTGLDAIARIPDPSGFPEGKIAVRAGAGCTMKALTEWCESESLAGLQRFAGLPGTVGGAVFMNARCYDVSIADAFFAADYLCFRSGRCTLEHTGYDANEWAYKTSPFQARTGADSLLIAEDSRVVVSADFGVIPGNRADIRREMESFVKDREDKGHYRFPSAGSMFRNNHDFGKPSGKIIDEAGLRGFRIGDAQVAPWHGNIVINLGNASASDLRALVDEIRKRVFETSGFALESEVILAGDW
jgi:UDP-N-acetylmuramate dehydrogenase